MARSSWKFFYINSNLYKYSFLSKFKNIKISKIFSRSSIVSKIFFKKTIPLYKGNIFVKMPFTKHHVGFKLGEFGVTRKPFSYPSKDKKVKR
jgi:ribosomal protein S19